MVIRKRRNLVVTAVAAATLLVAASASASGVFDGKTNLVCATTDVVGCMDGPGCMQGHARTFELPDFMVLDFEKKVVRATAESGHKQTSPIKSYEKTGTQLVLQGIENGHGWSMAVHRDNGRISTVVSGEELSFILFGVCTTLN